MANSERPTQPTASASSEPASQGKNSPILREKSATGTGSRLRAAFTRWLRRDWLAILLFAIAVVVMTYPLAFRLGEGLPSSGGDTLTALWQVWWLGEVVKNSYNANFSPLLFHPNGLDVTFQPHPWTALGTWRMLSLLFGEAAGYNLNTMLGLLVSAYATYLLIVYLTDNRAAAWIGGAFYAFYPAHVIRAIRQPTTGSIQWLSIFLLALVVSLDRSAASPQSQRNPRHNGLIIAALAGLSFSANAYISIKPWIQAVLLGALYVPLIMLANGWWRRPAFWRAVAVLVVVSLLSVLPVLYPYLLASSEIPNAIERGAAYLKRGADMAAFVKAAPELPVFVPRSLAILAGWAFSEWSPESFYLGLVAIVLVGVGLVDALSRDRRRLVWLAMALVFWGLSLGTILTINTVQFPEIWTPYQSVEQNIFFSTARVPFRFVLGFSLPWAVMVGYGAAYLWSRLRDRRWLARGVFIGLSALMLFELTEVPLQVIPTDVSSFYYDLRAEDEISAVIDVPMERLPSKRYMYLQTIHHQPIIQGTIARMPKGMYRYIRDNPMLGAWWDEEAPTCDYDVGQAIGDLQADGFRYVILHYRLMDPVPDWLALYFANVEPVFEDDFIAVYALSDLKARPPCASP